MKANEFVKKFGWDHARDVLEASKLVGIDNSIVDINDLKRLVESYDVVQKFGGLDQACNTIAGLNCVRQSALKQAISDVESCQNCNKQQ